MPRKNKRYHEEIPLATIKSEEEWRPHPTCSKFPTKTLFTSGYRAQAAIDDIKAISDREHTPERVYECKIIDGGCGYFHTTGMKELPSEME